MHRVYRYRIADVCSLWATG